MKKRILVLAVTIVALVAAAVLMINADTSRDYKANLAFEDDGVTAYCAVCDKKVEWTEVTSTTSLPIIKGGHSHYYLGSSFSTTKRNVAGPDANAEGSWFFLWIKSGTVCFHLNGQTLITNANVHMAGGKFNLLGSGTWTCDNASYGDSQPRGTVVHLHNTSAIANLYSGTVKATADGLHPVGINGHPTGAGGINIWGTTVEGGVVSVGGTINLKGGTINGRSELIGYYNTRSTLWYKPIFNMTSGTVTGLGTHGNEFGVDKAESPKDGDGGAFYLRQGATLNISGGTVNGGVVKSQGGAIYACTAVKDTTNNVTPAKCVVNISGTALIQKGFSWNYGGNLYMEAGTELNISGGTIKNGTACVRGGNIAALAGAVVNMTGGTLQNGVGGYSAGVTQTERNSWGGGNIYSLGATLNLTKGTVTGGRANASGGNIMAALTGSTPTSIVVGAECTISNGTSSMTAGYAGGGNIWIAGNATYNCTLEISGNLIGGTAGRYGGSIYASETAVTVKSGGSITGGSATYGGNINKFNTGDVTIEAGATVSNGVAKTSGGNIYISQGKLNIAGTVSQTQLPEGKTYNAIYGGNIYATTGAAAAADIHITGTVDGGIARNNGGAFIIASGADVTVESTGVIKNGYAMAHTDYSDRMGGGNVYMYSKGSTLTLNGGQIIDGTTDFCGGNVHTCNAGAVFTMNGGVVKGGTSPNDQDNVRLSTDSTMMFLGGTVYGTSGGAMGKGSAIHANNADVYLGGNATTVIENGQQVSHIYLAKNTGNLYVLDGWSGSSAVAPNSIMNTNVFGQALPLSTTTNYVACGKLVDGAFVKGGTYTGTLRYEYDALLPEIIATADGTMYVMGAQMVDAQGNATWTLTPVADFATGNYQYVKYYGGEIVLNGDLVLDINGKVVNTNGTGKLYAFDSANDTFDASKCGMVLVGGNVKLQTKTTVAGKQYVALFDAAGDATLHRVDMQLVGVALRAREAGYYYRAQYFFDDAVKAAILCHGIAVSKDNMPGSDFLDETKDVNAWTEVIGELTSGQIANSGSLFNVLKNGADNNQARGEIKVYANPYLALQTAKDEVVILVADEENADKQAGVGMSLKDVLVAIEASYDDLGATAQTTVKQFYAAWEDDIAAWAPELPKISAK